MKRRENYSIKNKEGVSALSSLSLPLFLLLSLSFCIACVSAAYNDQQQAEYLANFNNLISTSYSAPRPQALISACVAKGEKTWPLPEIFVTTNTDAMGLQQRCGTESVCVINEGVTVNLNANVNVAALKNRVFILFS